MKNRQLNKFENTKCEHEFERIFKGEYPEYDPWLKCIRCKYEVPDDKDEI